MDKEVKKLRRIAGGDTYTIIYLKLMLLSLKTDGKLYFDSIEDTFAEELALEIDEDPENVRVTLMYLEKMSLLQLINEDELYLTQMDNLILSESESAERVRKHRAKKKQIEADNEQLKITETLINQEVYQDGDADKTLQSNTHVTESNGEETNGNTYTYTKAEANANTKPQNHFPPTVEEVAEYCRERGNGIDAQEFIDYYEARNWYSGKTKIKKWKNCVNTWERNRNFKYTPKVEPKKIVEPVEDDAPSEEWQKMFEGCDYGDI